MSVGLILGAAAALAAAPAHAGTDRLLYCMVPRPAAAGETVFEHLSIYLPLGMDPAVRQTFEVFDPHGFLGAKTPDTMLTKANGFTLITSTVPVSQIDLTYVPAQQGYAGLVGHDSTKPNFVMCTLVGGSLAGELAVKFRADPNAVDHLK